VELDPSFDEFVVSGSARLLRSAYLLTGDRDHAEDVLQVVLMRTARRWDVARDAPHAYAHRVLVNVEACGDGSTNSLLMVLRTVWVRSRTVRRG